MNEEIDYADDFIVILTIDGSSYEEVEVKVTDTNKTIRDQIASIVSVFELPKLDNGGNPIQYLLVRLWMTGKSLRFWSSRMKTVVSSAWRIIISSLLTTCI